MGVEKEPTPPYRSGTETFYNFIQRMKYKGLTCGTVPFMTAMCLTGMYMPVEASIPEGIVSGTGSIAIGEQSSSAANYAIVIGNEATGNSRSDYTVAIGDHVQVSTSDSVVIGRNATTYELNRVTGQPVALNYPEVVAIGKNARVTGTQSVGIGSGVYAERHQAVAIGHNSRGGGDSSVALGDQSRTSSRRTLALGYKSAANAQNSMAIGAHAQTNAQRSIAMGVTAMTRSSNAIGIGSEAKGYATSAVALGDRAYANGASSLAMGRQSYTLGANSIGLGADTYSSGNSNQSISLGQGATTTDKQTISVGFGATTTAEQAMSLGVDALTTGGQSIAIGHGAYAGLKEEALENNLRSNQAYVAAEKAYYKALNDYESKFKATVDNSFVNTNTGELLLGDMASWVQDELLRITNKKHIANLDAINALEQIARTDSSMGEIKYLQSAAQEVLAARQEMEKAKKNRQTFSTVSTQSTALGDRARAAGQVTTALGAGATAIVDGGVALGAGSVAHLDKGIVGFNSTTHGAAANHRVHGYTPLQEEHNLARTSNWAGVSIGDEGHTRQIHYVAAGTADTDAVNVAQLKNVNLGFRGNTGTGDVRLYDQRLALVGADGGFVRTTAKDNTVEIAALTSTLEYAPDGTLRAESGLAMTQDIATVMNESEDRHSESIRRVREDISFMDSRLNRIGAQAAALSSLGAGAYDPLEPTQITVGLGNYKGKSAMALGVAHYINGSTLIRAGAALGGHRDELMANASLTWKFGHSPVESSIPNAFKGGPLQATYALQDKVSALEAKTIAQGERIYDLLILNEAQEQRMAELMALNEQQRLQMETMMAQLTALSNQINS